MNKFTIFIWNISSIDVYVVIYKREVFDTPVWNNIYTKLHLLKCDALFWCMCTEMHGVIAQSQILDSHISCPY